MMTPQRPCHLCFDGTYWSPSLTESSAEDGRGDKAKGQDEPEVQPLCKRRGWGSPQELTGHPCLPPALREPRVAGGYIYEEEMERNRVIFFNLQVQLQMSPGG